MVWRKRLEILSFEQEDYTYEKNFTIQFSGISVCRMWGQ